MAPPLPLRQHHSTTSSAPAAGVCQGGQRHCANGAATRPTTTMQGESFSPSVCCAMVPTSPHHVCWLGSVASRTTTTCQGSKPGPGRQTTPHYCGAKQSPPHPAIPCLLRVLCLLRLLSSSNASVKRLTGVSVGLPQSRSRCITTPNVLPAIKSTRVSTACAQAAGGPNRETGRQQTRQSKCATQHVE